MYLQIVIRTEKVVL